MEAEPLEESIYDNPRPGRPAKLTAEQQTSFEAALDEPPTEHGIDAPAWTPAVAQAYIRQEFGVEYTQRHVQRLLKAAGVSWQTSRPQPRTADAEEREQFRENLKKLNSTLPEKYTTVAIDQTQKSVGCELYRAWFPEGKRTTLPYWSGYKSVKLLDAVTDDGERSLRRSSIRSRVR